MDEGGSAPPPSEPASKCKCQGLASSKQVLLCGLQSAQVSLDGVSTSFPSYLLVAAGYEASDNMLCIPPNSKPRAAEGERDHLFKALNANDKVWVKTTGAEVEYTFEKWEEKYFDLVRPYHFTCISQLLLADMATFSRRYANILSLSLNELYKECPPLHASCRDARD